MTATRSPMTGATVSSANSKAMVVGLALVATGGFISLCGAGISGTAMVRAVRRWITSQQEPPGAIIRRKIAQARAATTAGANAWQDGNMAGAPRSR